MPPRTSSRGGPLIALCTVLCLWIVARAAFIPLEIHGGFDEPVLLPPAFGAVEPPLALSDFPQELRGSGSPFRQLASPVTERLAPIPSGRDRQPEKQPPAGKKLGNASAGVNVLPSAPFAAALATRGHVAAEPAAYYPAVQDVQPADERWSADGWLLLRPGGASALSAGAPAATYGASQIGAVLHYRIAPPSDYRPEVYLRVAAALGGGEDKELALGLSTRPFPTLPLRAAIELRVSDQAAGQEVRSAAMVVTEIMPVDLPHGTRAEIYGQAGYVGGEYATAFADGQARIDTQLGDLGDARLRGGAGAWAGAQEGASRVDIGPTATLTAPVGDGGTARLGLDWRMRVAGNAEPGSGPAVTLSASF